MMNQYYLNFILSLMPIAIGILILVLLRSFSYSNKKIIILEPEKEIKSLDNKVLHSEQLYNLFIDFENDELILNGISPKQKDIERVAFEKLSIVPFWNIEEVMSKKRIKELSLFASIEDLGKIICTYSPPSGIILAHILNNTLRVISYA